MDVLDKPADPNEVELTEGNKKTPPEKTETREQLIQKLVGEERLEKIGECYVSCNSKECNYDGGDCRHRYLNEGDCKNFYAHTLRARKYNFL